MNVTCEFVHPAIRKECGAKADETSFCDQCGFLCAVCSARPCPLTGSFHVLVDVSPPVPNPDQLPLFRPSSPDLPAMTFQEIAKELGLTAGNVEQIYRHAIQKLRRRPESLRKLAELVEFRRSIHRDPQVELERWAV
jgi:hypothetical protein